MAKYPKHPFWVAQEEIEDLFGLTDRQIRKLPKIGPEKKSYTGRLIAPLDETPKYWVYHCWMLVKADKSQRFADFALRKFLARISMFS